MLSSAAVGYQLRFGQDELCWAFGCNLLLLYLYSSAVGGRHSNEFPACSNTRSLVATFFKLVASKKFYNRSYVGLWFFIQPSSFSISPGRTYTAEHFGLTFCFLFSIELQFGHDVLYSATLIILLLYIFKR